MTAHSFMRAINTSSKILCCVISPKDLQKTIQYYPGDISLQSSVGKSHVFNIRSADMLAIKLDA